MRNSNDRPYKPVRIAITVSFYKGSFKRSAFLVNRMISIIMKLIPMKAVSIQESTCKNEKGR